MTLDPSPSPAPPTSLPDPLATALIVVDPLGQCRSASASAALLLRRAPGSLQGLPVWEAVPAPLDQPLKALLEAVAQGGEAQGRELYCAPWDVWLELLALPHEGGVTLHLRDISERKAAEQQPEHLLNLTRALVSAQTEEDVIRAALDIGLPAAGAYAGLVLLVSEDGTELGARYTHGYDPSITEQWRSYALSTHLPITDAVRLRRPVFVREAQFGTYPALLRDHAAQTRSVAALPLWAGDAVYGCLALSFEHDQRFAPTTQQFLTSLAAQFGLAFDRVRLARYTARQASTSAFLAEASELLSGSLDEQATLEQLTRLAVPRLADWCGVYLPRGEMIEATAVTHSDPSKVESLRQLVRRVPMHASDAGGAPQIIRTGQVNFLPEVTDEMLAAMERDPEQLEWVRSIGLRSALGVPMIANGQVIGAVQLVQAESGRRFTADDIPVAVDFARRAALALSNARLYRASQTWGQQLEEQVQARTAELQDATEALHSRTLALEAFATLAQGLAEDAEPLDLIQGAQHTLLTLLPNSASTYYELEAGIWRLCAVAGDLHSPALEQALRAGLPRGQVPNLDRPFDTRQPLYQSAYRAGPWDAGTALTQHLRATAAFPVLMGADVAGVLVVGSFDQHAWPQAQREMLETGVRHLGLALHRSRVLRELSERNATLAERTAELQELNAELEAFSYTISHDLRAPVRQITGLASLLRRVLGEQVPERAAKPLGMIELSAARMMLLIDALLGLAHTSRQALRCTDVSVQALVQDVIEDLNLGTTGPAVQWSVGPLPAVYADAPLLRQVLANLLGNAVKYSATRPDPQVTVTSQEQPGEHLIIVSDNGVGFDPQHADRLFGVFQRLHRDDEFEGTGIGLATVRRIVARHGGRVWAEGRPGQGARFVFTLPRRNGSETPG